MTSTAPFTSSVTPNCRAPVRDLGPPVRSRTPEVTTRTSPRVGCGHDQVAGRRAPGPRPVAHRRRPRRREPSGTAARTPRRASTRLRGVPRPMPRRIASIRGRVTVAHERRQSLRRRTVRCRPSPPPGPARSPGSRRRPGPARGRWPVRRRRAGRRAPTSAGAPEYGPPPITRTRAWRPRGSGGGWAG